MWSWQQAYSSASASYQASRSVQSSVHPVVVHEPAPSHAPSTPHSVPWGRGVHSTVETDGSQARQSLVGSISELEWNSRSMEQPSRQSPSMHTSLVGHSTPMHAIGVHASCQQTSPSRHGAAQCKGTHSPSEQSSSSAHEAERQGSATHDPSTQMRSPSQLESGLHGKPSRS